PLAVALVVDAARVDDRLERVPELAVIRSRRGLGKGVDRVIDEIAQLEHARDIEGKLETRDRLVESLERVRRQVQRGQIVELVGRRRLRHASVGLWRKD